MFAPQFNERLGLSESQLNLCHGIFAEAAFSLEVDFRLALRYLNYTNSHSIVFRSIEYEITHSGSAIMAGLQKDVSVGTSFDSRYGGLRGFGAGQHLVGGRAH